MVNFVGIKRVCGVEISDLPCLASGRNSNLISNDMADIWRQGIYVEDENDPDPQKNPYHNWKRVIFEYQKESFYQG